MDASTIERAGLLGWWLRGGERVDPRAVAGRLGIEARQVEHLLRKLSRSLPITDAAGVWTSEVSMTENWTPIPAEQLPADSVLGRAWRAWQAAAERERAAATKAGDLRRKLAEKLEFLAAAKYGETAPAQFAEAQAEAELLKRALPAEEAQVELLRGHAQARRAAFNNSYQSYLRSLHERSDAVYQGNAERIRRAETHILSLVGT